MQIHTPLSILRTEWYKKPGPIVAEVVLCHFALRSIVWSWMHCISGRRVRINDSLKSQSLTNTIIKQNQPSEEFEITRERRGACLKQRGVGGIATLCFYPGNTQTAGLPPCRQISPYLRGLGQERRVNETQKEYNAKPGNRYTKYFFVLAFI
jgi:hypothetical protein